jgi:hypothetical protein
MYRLYRRRTQNFKYYPEDGLKGLKPEGLGMPPPNSELGLCRERARADLPEQKPESQTGVTWQAGRHM